MSADDQAAGLRTLARRRSTEARRAAPGAARVLCVAGRGDVAQLAAALGEALARGGNRALLVSIGRRRDLLPGGSNPTLPSLDAWVRGDSADARDAVVETPGGLRLVGLGGALASWGTAPPPVRARLLEGLRSLDGLADLVVFEVGARIGPAEAALARCASEVLIATPPDPHGMAHAYALIKAVARADAAARVGIVTTPCDTVAQGLSASDRLVEVVTRFLAIRARSLGAIPRDPHRGASLAEVAGGIDAIAETLSLSACRTRDPERGLGAAASRLAELWSGSSGPRHRDGG